MFFKEKKNPERKFERDKIYDDDRGWRCVAGGGWKTDVMVVSAKDGCAAGGAGRERPFRMQNRSRLSNALTRAARDNSSRQKLYYSRTGRANVRRSAILSEYTYNLSARRKPHVHAFPRGTACNTVMSLNIEVAVVAPSPLFFTVWKRSDVRRILFEGADGTLHFCMIVEKKYPRYTFVTMYRNIIFFFLT